MNIIQVLQKLRDDIKSWVITNLKAIDAKIGDSTVSDQISEAIDNIDIPSKVSQLENDNNYISSIPDEYPTIDEVQELVKSVRIESPSGLIYVISVTDDGALITEKEENIN